MLILDGCSTEALRKAKTPHIDEIRKSGSYSFRCRSVHPTVTYSAHASILTGVHPNLHGIVGNCFYDRENKTIVDFDVKDVNRYLSSKTVFERIKGIKIAVGEPIVRGADIIVSKKEVQDKELFNQDMYAIDRAIELIEEKRPVIAVINLPGIDRIGETYGPLSKELLDHLEEIDRWINALLKSLEEIYDDYLLILLSDHGMVEVRENIDLREVIDLDAIICISHRAAHVYLREEGLRGAEIRLRRKGKYKLICREELIDYHLDNPRSGDMIVIAKKRYEFGPEPLKGSHGGDAKSEVLVPLILNKPEYVNVLREADITMINKIALIYLREARAISLAKELLGHADPAHKWDHTSRVLSRATGLAIRYDADIEAVKLSCIFHDLGRAKGAEGHEERSAHLAEKFLIEEGCPEELIEKVKRTILRHHLSHHDLESTEEKILWDADKLDSIGLVGLARCFLEEGFRKRGIEDAIEHLLKDLSEFKNAMHFKETKRLAKVKEVDILRFIKKLEKELNRSL